MSIRHYRKLILISTQPLTDPHQDWAGGDRAARGKVPVQQIGRDGLAVVAVRGGLEALGMARPQVQFCHDRPGLVAACGNVPPVAFPGSCWSSRASWPTHSDLHHSHSGVV